MQNERSEFPFFVCVVLQDCRKNGVKNPGRVNEAEENRGAKQRRRTENKLSDRRWRCSRRARALWGEPAGRAAKDLNGARAHVLLENTFWLTAQFRRYAPDQHPRVIERLMDLFTHGLAVPGARWAPVLQGFLDALPGWR